MADMDTLDMDQFLHYNELLGDMMDCEEEECGPPLFSVPPPPPPPWLEMPPLCDTCGSVPAVATVTNTAQEVFRSAVVVTVLAACLTIAALTLAVALRRRLASRAKHTSAENLTADSAALATAAEKQLPTVRPPPQNYYSRDHRVLVDRLGRASLLGPDQPIYETIDGEDVYSEQYSEQYREQYREQYSQQYSQQYSLPHPALLYKPQHMGVVSLYENPDGVSLYQPASNTLYQPSTANTLYCDQGSLNTSSQYQEVAPCHAPPPATPPGCW